jgi:hypothetical protein
MAEKRMFTQKICDSDAFLDMPLTTQALYFHLNMRADDDGFVNNPKKIQRMIGASEDDLKLLVLKRFILTFDNGVIVIKHWRMHNLLRKDRYHPTQYQEELALLDLKENGSYTEKISENTEVIELATNWQPTGNHLATEVSVGKVRLDKVSVGKCSTEETQDHTQHTEITYESLCKRYGKDFVDERIRRAKSAKYKMTDNIETVAKWCEEDAAAGRTKKTKFSNFPNRDYDVSDLERKLLMSGQG